MTTATQPLNSLDVKAFAARNGDLRAYAKAVHNLEIEEYQEAWEEALDSFNRVVIVCPPDTFKSTTVQMWVERAIGLNPNIRILWLMNSGDQAEKRVMTVGQTIATNPVYRRAFGVKEDKDAQWTKSVLFVKRGFSSPDPTLMGAGLNGPYQGLHFDVIVIDDPTNQEDVRSPTTMELQRTKLRGVIIDRLVEGGRIMSILTRWGENDLVPDLLQMGFRMIHMPLIGTYPWGPTISNKRFPPEKVETVRRDKGDYLFQLTYMGDPGAGVGGYIKREHIQYWDETSLPQNGLIWLMAVDPAASLKSYADPSCIGIGGLDPKERKLYITDMWTQRVEVPELKRQIVRMAKQVSNIHSIGLETVGFQLTLMQELRRTYQLPVIELPYRSRRNMAMKPQGLDRDKISRAAYVDSMFTAGRLLVPKYLPLSDGQSYETELLQAGTPTARHDDRMDVTSFLCAMADAYAPGGFFKQKVRIGYR